MRKGCNILKIILRKGLSLLKVEIFRFGLGFRHKYLMQVIFSLESPQLFRVLTTLETLRKYILFLYKTLREKEIKIHTFEILLTVSI